MEIYANQYIAMGLKLKIVKDTCAFDSLLQVIMSAIATYPSYKEAVYRIDCKIIKLAERVLTNGKVTATELEKSSRELEFYEMYQFSKSRSTRDNWKL